jgi:phosphatidylglycerophosphate synthase
MKYVQGLRSPWLWLCLIAAVFTAITFCATFYESGATTPDLLITVYGSLLGSSITILALIGILISLVVERRINRGLDILDEIQEKRWESLLPEESQLVFDSLKRVYKIRYKKAQMGRVWKHGMSLIYILCLAVSILTLFSTAYILETTKTGMIGAFVYSLAAGLLILSLLGFGYLLRDLLSLRKGWIFILNHWEKLGDLDFLGSPQIEREGEHKDEGLELDFKTIMVSFGLIRVQAVLRQIKEYYLKIRSPFRDLKAKSEICFETGERTLIAESRSFEDQNPTKPIILQEKDCPTIFQGTTPWRLRIELRGPFPDGFCKDKESKILFKGIRYIFQEETREREVGVPINFKLREVAYMKPEETIDDFTWKETWITIFRSHDKSGQIQAN